MGLQNLPAVHKHILVLAKSVMYNGLFTYSLFIHDSENSTIRVSLRQFKTCHYF